MSPLALLLLALPACHTVEACKPGDACAQETGRGTDGDTDTGDQADTGDHTDTGSDADTDADTDTDTDADADGDTDSDGDTDADTDTDTSPCAGTLTDLQPPNGTRDVYYRDAVVFTMNISDPDATVSADFTGITTLSDDGRTVTYTPDPPLAPDTSYAATLTACFGEATTHFRTSEVGAPLADPSDLVGGTWALELSAGDITEPPGIGAVLGSYLTYTALVGVTAASDSTISLMLTIASQDSAPPAQDPEVNTRSWPDADFTASPAFSLGLDDLTAPVAGYTIPAEQVTLTGTFAPDGSYIGGAEVAGYLDTSALAPIIDPSSPGAVCDLAATFGASCEACPSDGSPYCLSFREEHIPAERVDGLTLVEVTDGTTSCTTGRAPRGAWTLALAAVAVAWRRGRGGRAMKTTPTGRP